MTAVLSRVIGNVEMRVVREISVESESDHEHALVDRRWRRSRNLVVVKCFQRHCVGQRSSPAWSGRCRLSHRFAWFQSLISTLAYPKPSFRHLRELDDGSAEAQSSLSARVRRTRRHVVLVLCSNSVLLRWILGFLMRYVDETYRNYCSCRQGVCDEEVFEGWARVGWGLGSAIVGAVLQYNFGHCFVELTKSLADIPGLCFPNLD